MPWRVTRSKQHEHKLWNGIARIWTIPVRGMPIRPSLARHGRFGSWPEINRNRGCDEFGVSYLLSFLCRNGGVCKKQPPYIHMPNAMPDANANAKRNTYCLVPFFLAGLASGMRVGTVPKCQCQLSCQLFC